MSLLAGLVVALVAVTLALIVPAQADTTITVTTTSDVVASDGLCSLREAIIAANTDAAFNGCPAGSGADTVVFGAGLPQPATFVLTRSGANEDAASTGDLDVVGTLTINGEGLGNTILDGNGSDRVFEIRPGAHVTISGVTIRNGAAGAGLGGGIKVLGALTLSDSSVESNMGGGISNVGGSLELSNVQVTNNTGDYGIRNQNQAAFGFVGGLVSGNQGGGIYNATSSATLSALSIVDNTGGGGVYNTGASLTHLSMSQVTVMTNTATSGGGIFNEGVGAVIDIHNTRVSGNQASAAGGGVFNNGIMTINSSLIDHNQARSGGAVEHFGGTLHLINDTLSGNTAADNGGGLYNLGNATLTNVTLSHNVASGPGTGGNIFNDEGQLAMVNSLVAHADADGNCFNSTGFIHSLGYNLASDNTCGLTATGDQPNTDPLLGPLQDNGGDTPTHALLPGSPAIDQGDDTACPATDQRGIPRPQGAACDIGAYESGDSTDLTLAVSVTPYLVGPSQRMTYTLVVNNLGPSTAMSLVLTDSLPSGVTFIAADIAGGGTCAHSDIVSCTLSSLGVGTSVTSTIAVTAPASLGVLTNVAQVTSATPDLDPGNSQVTTITPVSQIHKIYFPLILRD